MAGYESSPKPSTEYDGYLKICVWNSLELRVITDFSSSSYYASHHLACLVYNIIQTLLNIVLNFLAIFAFWKSAQLRRKTTFFVVMVLSANDLAIGLFAQPQGLVLYSREFWGHQNCLGAVLTALTFDVLLSISMATFLILNFEIYLSIIHPIFHKTKITNRRVFYLLLILWCANIVRVYLFAFYIDKDRSAVAITLSMTSIILAMVFMHSRIFITVYKRRRIEAMASSNSARAFLRGIRDAKSYLLVLVCTLCCYLPFAIENVAQTQRATFNRIILRHWCSSFVVSASVSNSIVFYWRNKILRKEAVGAVKDFFTLCLRDSDPV
jgi:hypothetical protein